MVYLHLHLNVTKLDGNDQFLRVQTLVCFHSLKKSKKCVQSKNPVRADLFDRFFCGFLETAGRFGGRAAVGRANFCDRRPDGLQFNSNFVQQLQPSETIWSLAQRAPAFLRLVPRRAVLACATAHTLHTFFRFFPSPFIL